MRPPLTWSPIHTPLAVCVQRRYISTAKNEQRSSRRQYVASMQGSNGSFNPDTHNGGLPLSQHWACTETGCGFDGVAAVTLGTRVAQPWPKSCREGKRRCVHGGTQGTIIPDSITPPGVLEVGINWRADWRRLPTRGYAPKPVVCWVNVADVGPTYSQLWRPGSLMCAGTSLQTKTFTGIYKDVTAPVLGWDLVFDIGPALPQSRLVEFAVRVAAFRLRGWLRHRMACCTQRNCRVLVCAI